MSITLRIRLTDSLYLDPLPELASTDQSAVVVTPGDFGDWDEMFTSHPDALDYLLTPGDYRSWGRLHKHDHSIPSGTQARRRTIRYHDPEVASPAHPVRRVGGSEVVVDASDVQLGKHVIFHGLTFRPTEQGQATFVLRPGATTMSWICVCSRATTPRLSACTDRTTRFSDA